MDVANGASNGLAVISLGTGMGGAAMLTTGIGFMPGIFRGICYIDMFCGYHWNCREQQLCLL